MYYCKYKIVHVHVYTRVWLNKVKILDFNFDIISVVTGDVQDIHVCTWSKRSRYGTCIFHKRKIAIQCQKNRTENRCVLWSDWISEHLPRPKDVQLESSASHRVWRHELSRHPTQQTTRSTWANPILLDGWIKQKIWLPKSWGYPDYTCTVYESQ